MIIKTLASGSNILNLNPLVAFACDSSSNKINYQSRVNTFSLGYLTAFNSLKLHYYGSCRVRLVAP